MSESQGASPSVLLPNATISLFAKDAELRAAAIALRDDWRFARVHIHVADGDVETAIDYYAQNPSPDLVVVETLEITDGFSGRLEVLAGNCAENTAAIVVGPVNDVYLYRKLIDMGVSDYLVKPLTTQVLSDVLAKTLIERLGAAGSKLIAYIGSKGGVGTSTLAQLSATAMANDLGQKTIILDTAAGWSYLSVAMGGEATTTLHEVSRAAVSPDKDSFKRMIVTVGEKLSYMATGAEPLLDESVSAENIELVINRLMQSYPVVVIDLSRASPAVMRTVLSRANDVVVITIPTLPALRASRSLIQEMQNLRGGGDTGLHLVVNMKGITQGQDVSDADIQSVIKLKSLLSLTFAPKVFTTAEVQGRKISDISGGQDIYKSILSFLEKELRISVVGRVADKDKTTVSTISSGGLSGFINKLKSK